MTYKLSLDRFNLTYTIYVLNFTLRRNITLLVTHKEAQLLLRKDLISVHEIAFFFFLLLLPCKVQNCAFRISQSAVAGYQVPPAKNMQTKCNS